jgi:hypothetical protein
MLVLATGLLATALLASNGYVHRPAVRLHQSLRCLADSEPAASDSAGNGDDADGLTMGDVLAAIASRQQGALPLEDLVDETRGSIDAMLEFGSDELDEIAYELAADLRSVQRNASSTATERRIEAEQAVLQRFDRSAAAVQREFDVGRSEIAAVRLKLDELRAERAAAQEAEPRSRGTARGRGWYGDAATDNWLQARLETAQRAQPEMLRAAQLSTSAIGLLGLLGLLSLALGPGAAPELARVAWSAGVVAALAVYLASMARIMLD